MRIRDQRCASLFQNSHGHGSADRWKLIQEDLEGITFFKVVEQVLYRHPGACEYWRTTLDIWVNGDAGTVHVQLPKREKQQCTAGAVL